MGYDIYGNNKDKNGEETYFRNNVWYWRPLWNYVAETCKLSDEIVEQGFFNDGYAVSKEEAEKISKTLFAELKANKTQTYDLKYKKHIKNLPYITCRFCGGTGKRDDDRVQGDCNACNTEGTREQGIPIGFEKSWEASYPFDVDNVKEFAQFCADSGGFKIY